MTVVVCVVLWCCSLLVTIVDLSEFLHKQSALSPSNLFRKVGTHTSALSLARACGASCMHAVMRSNWPAVVTSTHVSSACVHRQQYGNLEHVFSYEHLDQLFVIDNSVIKLQPLVRLQTARQSQYIPQDLFEQCVEMHRVKRTHDLTTLKTVGKNECRRCRNAYSTLANTAKACEGGANHEPAYDFDLHPDVLKCEIVQ
jgi:hypothetical protein